jgi:hypothetical protein
LACQQFRLLEDGGCGLLLLVGRISVLAEDTFDQDAQLRSNVLADGSVDGDVPAYGLDELAGNRARSVSLPSTFTALSFVSSAS